MHSRVITTMLFAAILIAIFPAVAFGAGGQNAQIAAQLPLVSLAPFVGLLVSIAVAPLVARHWWESNRNKAIVAAGFALPIVIYMTARWGGDGLELIGEKLFEYYSFIILLGALYVISGGIYIGGSFQGSPAVNTIILTAGTLLASLIGTTGASMLLIRPLLRANRSRCRQAHIIVFFIFTVSNCGGLLTPLGDPPLFLGFMAGVPFTWTLRLWPQWALVNGALLANFFIWDTLASRRDQNGSLPLGEDSHPTPDSRLPTLSPLVIDGWHNFLFLAAIVAIDYAAGSGVGFGGQPWHAGIQELLTIALGAAAYVTTPKRIRAENKFDFVPLTEVSVLFAGIFVTMAPALLVLNARSSQLGLSQPWHFFWASGVLSGVLDSAPAYMTFASVAAGLQNIPVAGRYLAEYLALPPAAGAPDILSAISCGSVFMGALTYIGNGPNFMVKAIAEESGVQTPSFFGYLVYSGAILLPLLVLITLLFFR